MINKVFGTSGGSNYTPDGKVPVKNSFEIEGEMLEANSAQMKAMHDAKVKKMEDDKVAAKKKKVDEACWKGYEKKGMKTMFGKRYPNCVKKTKKEEVELEAKKSCGEGEYYCHDDQKCKPIPDGMKVGKDGMLVKEDMKGMSQKSGDKRSTESGAGMTAKGVAKYNRRTGGNLKTAVTTPPSKLKAGSKAAKRRKSFCARSRSWTGPRGKAARRRWNCSYEPELPMIIDEKKLYNGAPLSDRVAAWTKKISEALTPDRNAVGLPKDLKSVEKKIKNSKTGRMNTGGDGTASRFDSYIPQGEMIEAKKYKGKINRDVLKKNPKLNPNKPGDYIRLKRMTAKADKINERKMTSSEKDKKEKYVKGMKKVKGDFTKRYGKDGKSVMYATATKMAMKEGVPIIPAGAALTAAGLATWKFIKGMQTKNQMQKAIDTPGTNLNKIKTNNDIKNKYMDMLNQSYEPQGEMTEAKYERGASTYGKASIRNKRMFGKGGNARPPEERGAAIKVRQARHQERRYVKKGNKYHEPGKYRPEVHGVTKPEQERKGKNIKEGSLHKWFKGSKSKDGKPGWVNVVTGGTCASDKKGEGTPKCVSSSKRASMTKAERLSASRRKKKADPGQQSKSGAAKPTYVATDKKKKVDEMNQGPSTPVGNYDGKIMPKFGAGRIGNVRLKGGKSIADLLKKP